MLLALLHAALAAPPSLETPLQTGDRAKKDLAVIVSEGDYQHLSDVPAAEADAKLMYDFLAQTRGIDPERITWIKDGNRDETISALRATVGAAKGKTTLWVYFVGQGLVTADGDRMLLLADAPAADPTAGGISVEELATVLTQGKAARVMLMVDAGFGGIDRNGEATLAAPKEVPAPVTPASERLSVWTATSGGEGAPLFPDAGHGMFTYFLVGALRGWADGALGSAPDGSISLQEASTYVAKVLRQVGGPELKSTRESRGGPNSWVLTESAILEEGPSKEALAEMAKLEKTRRVEMAQGKVRTTAKAEWAEILPVIEAGGDPAKAALQGFIEKYDVASARVDGMEVAIVVPEVADARARLDAMSRVTGKKKKGKKSRKKVAPAIPEGVVLSCANLQKYEATVIQGLLNEEDRTCLDNRLAMETVQTTKDKISRMLLINADAKGDTEEWLALAARHLEDIDRSDPDLCFKYALVLSRGDVSDGDEVLKWADYALENKSVWEGPLYLSRVYNLHRLKAETATRMWRDAEADLLEERSEENEELSERYRGSAKTFAREWLDYARASGQPLDRAHTLCLSASGSEDFCPLS